MFKKVLRLLGMIWICLVTPPLICLRIVIELISMTWFYMRVLPGVLLFIGTLGFSRAIRLAIEERREKAAMIKRLGAKC